MVHQVDKGDGVKLFILHTFLQYVFIPLSIIILCTLVCALLLLITTWPTHSHTDLMTDSKHSELMQNAVAVHTSDSLLGCPAYKWIHELLKMCFDSQLVWIRTLWRNCFSVLNRTPVCPGKPGKWFDCFPVMENTWKMRKICEISWKTKKMSLKSGLYQCCPKSIY